MALHVASSAFQGSWGLEDMPERFGTGLTVGWEVVQRRNELMAFMIDEVGLLCWLHCFHLQLLPALPLISVEDLQGNAGVLLLSIMCWMHLTKELRGFPRVKEQ